MNRLLTFLLTSLTIIAIAPQAAKAADAVDSEGYPVFYLRGTFNRWSCPEENRFNREGNVYTYTAATLDGEFKIGNSDWTLNLGGSQSQRDVTESCTLMLVHDGPNLRAANLTDVTIRFEANFKNYSGKMLNTAVSFAVNGETPEPIKPIKFEPSGTLPIIYIDAWKSDAEGNLILDDEGNPIHDDDVIYYNLRHKDYFQATYYLDLNGCEWLEAEGAQSVGSADAPLPMEIKARGNWTRLGYSKKPFKIKLGKKQNLLGLTPKKSKHYVLLAHADDCYGYLRNFTGFALGKRLGLPWTPSQQPIEVVINGDYRGLYFLTESIRVGDGCVDIAELADNEADPSLISGGYIVELDNYENPTNQLRFTEKHCSSGHVYDELRISFESPEEYSDIQTRFITDQIVAINDLIGENSDEVWSYIDMDDLARYYLVKEVLTDIEAFHGSTFMFRDRGEGQKWHFGPLWDCGQAFNGATSKFFYDSDPWGNTWITSFRCNALFNKKVEETWLWLCSNSFQFLYDEIDLYAERIAAAAIADHKRWDGAIVPPGGSPVQDNSNMSLKKSQVCLKLQEKIRALLEKIGDPGDKVYPEPERDRTPAALLPEYAQSGVVLPSADAASGSKPEYYDMMGRRVAKPVRGQIYIRRAGNEVTKFVAGGINE